MKKPVALIIRDGWGISPNGTHAAQKEGNAPLLAQTPFHDHLYTTYPCGTLSGSGEDVGLPEGQMGNSEVGHLNLGAGRIVYQDLTRINLAIRDGSFFKNNILLDLIQSLKQSHKRLHLIGLVSDGGVHSHLNHAIAIAQLAHQNGFHNLLVHAITDGRDTSPTGAVEYIRQLRDGLNQAGSGTLATIVGRYYAMDRDKRWERTKLAYDLIMNGIGTMADDPIQAIEQSYQQEITDEFIKPICLIKEPRPIVQEGDGILFFNFRADRTRQLSQAWLLDSFDGFDRGPYPKIQYVTLTQYDKTYAEHGVRELFPPSSMKNILGEVVSAAGKQQLRMAETEKYPHVTYFFNGGVEAAFPGEDREMAPSPKVATYDLQPEMSANELTEAVLKRLDSGQYDLLILNYANPDMVGHTGSLPAAIRAVETVDACLKRVVEKILSLGGCALITADHGNCEQMFTPDGKPHTAHTTNLVHTIFVANDTAGKKLRHGILADVAPTLLELLNIPKPQEMTGTSLFQ